MKQFISFVLVRINVLMKAKITKETKGQSSLVVLCCKFLFLALMSAMKSFCCPDCCVIADAVSQKTIFLVPSPRALLGLEGSLVLLLQMKIMM